MKRLFRIKEWGHTCDSEGYVERVLEVGDNIRVGEITYRIMEDPYDGLIMCQAHDINNGEDYIQFHEDEVDEVIWTEYTD